MVAFILVVGAGCFFYYRYRQVKPAARDLVPRPIGSGAAAGAQDRADRPSSASVENPARGPLPQRNPAATPERLTLQPLGPEERRRIREEILGGVNLTAEQREKIDMIVKQYGDSLSPEDLRRRMEAIGRILTPSQRDAVYETMRKRARTYVTDRLEMLPPEEREKFLQKLNERMEQRRREIERAIASPEPPR